MTLRVSLTITGVDEDVANAAFESSYSVISALNSNVDCAVSEPHDDTRGIYGMFIIRENNTTSKYKQDLAKAVKFIVENKLPSTTKAAIQVKVTTDKGE